MVGTDRPRRHRDAQEPRTAGLLAPYRVLDLSDRKGWLCGRIMGDLGADVVKVEPPGGDAGRRVGPFYGDDPDPGKSLAWLAYNANKRGVTLALDTGTGQALLRRLAQRADFLIESFPPRLPGRAGSRVSGAARDQSKACPDLDHPIRPDGPPRPLPGLGPGLYGDERFMSLVGEPGRPPLCVTLPPAAMWAGMRGGRDADRAPLVDGRVPLP
jgi:hypothetical protein